jgi:hypothetical protein
MNNQYHAPKFPGMVKALCLESLIETTIMLFENPGETRHSQLIKVVKKGMVLDIYEERHVTDRSRWRMTLKIKSMR